MNHNNRYLDSLLKNASVNKNNENIEKILAYLYKKYDPNNKLDLHKYYQTFDKYFINKTLKGNMYPNGLYLKFLVYILFNKLEESKEYLDFLIALLWSLEENAITGVISINNLSIKNRLKKVKKQYKLPKQYDTNSISNSHLVGLITRVISSL